MTNAEWLIQNKIPFQNINIHIDNIKGIANVYVKGYEKIIYNLESNDPNDETANTFSVLRFFESWLDNEADEMLFVKKILNKKEKNWIVNLIKPFYQKIEHLIDIEVMRHVKDDKIENDLNCIQISYTNRIFDSDNKPNGTETFRQTIELPNGSDICANMVADREYSVMELNLGLDFNFES
jgi:phosphoglucomutase